MDRPTDAMDTNRLEAFSDGVLAMAITLLVIEVRPPELETGESLLHALLGEWPSYVSYPTSFLIIGIIWINHHNIFRLIARIDHPLIVLNLALLACVAFIPFPTALLAEHLAEENGGNVAAAVYSLVLTVTSIFYNLLWRHASKDRRLIQDWVPDSLVRGITRWFLLGPVIYGASFLVALVSAPVSLALYALLALIFLVPRDRAARAAGRVPARP